MGGLDTLGGGGLGRTSPQQPAFGQSKPAGGAFGGATSGFGSSPGAGGGFGQASTGGFGGGNGGGFGSGATAAPASGGFGAPSAGGSFGQPAGNLNAGGFGNQGTSSPFGTNPAQTGAFGAQAQQQTAFGTTQPAGGGFGTTSSGFGSSGGGFGASTTPGGFGQMGALGGMGGGAQSGSGNPPFKATVTEEKANGTTTRLNIQAITAMEEYSSKSFEELRMEDYKKPNKGVGQGGQAQQQSGAFGASSTGLGGFGGAQSAQPSFGSNPGGFGSSPAGFGAGATTTSGGGFGSTGASTGGFGAPAAGGFGAAASSGGFGGTAGGGFGAAPANPAGGFGSTTPGTGAFGATSAPTSGTLGGGFGTSAPSATGAFGSTTGSTGGFGSSTSLAPGQAAGGAGQKSVGFTASTTGGFGAPGISTAGGFGSIGGAPAKPAAGGFGSLAAPSSTTGGFGTGFGSTPGFGASASTTSVPGSGFGSGIGSNPGATAGAFGSTSTTGGFGSSPAGGFGSSVGGFGKPAAPALNGFGQSQFGGAGAPVGAGGAGAAVAQAGVIGMGMSNGPGGAMVPSYEGTGYSKLASSQSGLDGFQRVDRMTERTQRHLDMRLSADQSGNYQLGNEQSGYTKEYPSYRHPSAGTNAHIDSSIVIRESPPKRQPASLKSNLPPSSSLSSTTTSSALVDVNEKRQDKDLPAVPVSQASDNPPPNPFGALASVPAPVAVMQGKANVVEDDNRPGEDRVPPTPAAGESGGEKTGLTPDVTTTPTGGSDSFNVVEKGNVNLGLASGYITAPAIRVLESMSETSLQDVKDFQISLPQFGSVQWQEPVDLTGLNLANAVQFYHNAGGWVEVSVHDKEGEPKYSIGEKLNKRALVTLYDYFPRKEWSQEKKMAFGRSLKAFNEKSGATFCNYDEERGQWQFFVNHFSKWGFDDSFFDEQEVGLSLCLDADRSNTAMSEEKGDVPEPKGQYGDTSESFLNAQGPTEGVGASSHTGRAGAMSTSHPVGPYTDAQQQQKKSVNFGVSRFVEPGTASESDDMDTRVEDPSSGTSPFRNKFAGGTPFRATTGSTFSFSSREGEVDTPTGGASPFSKFINHVSRSAPSSEIKPVPAYTPALGGTPSAGKGLLGPHSELASSPYFPRNNPYFPRSTAATPVHVRKESQEEETSGVSLPDRLSPARLRLGEERHESASLACRAPVIEPAIVRHARTLVDRESGSIRAYDGKSPTMTLLLQAKQQHQQELQQPRNMTKPAVGETSRMRDYGLSMRRSFRVGWSRDGRIVHPGKMVFRKAKKSCVDAEGDDYVLHDELSQTQMQAEQDYAKNGASVDIAYGKSHRVCVEKVECLRWFRSLEEELGVSSSMEHLVERPMQALLQACELDPQTAWLVQDNAEGGIESGAEVDAPNRLTSIAPLWRLPSATPEDLPRYSRFLGLLRDLGRLSDERRLEKDHPDWSIGAVVSLFSAVCGQEEHVTQALSTCTREIELQELDDRIDGEGMSPGGASRGLGYEHLHVAGVSLAKTLLPLYEAREDVPVALWERRREALSAWLERITAASASRPDLLHDPTGSVTESPSAIYNDIFELLCCHRIEDAVALAQTGGLYRLATLLSQTDGDDTIVQALRHQLQQWYLSGFDSTVPRELLDVYRLISGEFVLQSVAEDGHQARGKQWSKSIFTPARRAAPLAWSQCIGALFWYGGTNDALGSLCRLLPTGSEGKGKMSSALMRYRAALDLQEEVKEQEDGASMGPLVPPPESDFVYDDRGGSDVSEVNHGLFSLLELLLTEGNAEAETPQSVQQCIEALRCEGYTRDPLDYRCSFVVLALLECIGFVDQGDERAVVVRQNFIAQLCSHGHFKWAIFVACQLENDAVRTYSVKQLLSRWAASSSWDGDDSKGGESADVAFLVHRLRIPVSWVHEATAHREGYARHFSEQAAHLIKAFLACATVPGSQNESGRLQSLYLEAHRVICDDIAPLAVLRSGKAATDLAKLLALLRHEMGHADMFTKRNRIFEGYLTLRARVQGILAPEPVESCDSMDAEVAVPVELTAKDIMEEAVALLKQLSEFVEEEEAAEERVSASKHVKPSLVTLQKVTTLDMGSYLKSIVYKGEELQAQARLDSIYRDLTQDETLTAVERDRVFGEHVKKSTQHTVSFLSSLPSNCVEESSKRRLESIIRLKQA